MGRRNPRQRLSTAVLVAVLAITLLGTHASPLQAVGAQTGGSDAQTIESLPSESPPRETSDPESPGVREPTPTPEYPSSHTPQPYGSESGPALLLSNVISSHHFDDAWSLG